MEKILSTSNYKMFEVLAFNRDVEKVAPLRESMLKHGWVSAYPLNVKPNGNGKLKIKDGHHRFEIARELGIPIKYVVCRDESTIYELDAATRKWTMRDYLNSHTRDGKIDYRIVHEYCRKTGISVRQAISLLVGEAAGSGNQCRRFRAGDYVVKETHHADVVADIVRCMRENGIEWASHSYLVNALSRIAFVDEFSADILKQKIKTFPYLIEKRPHLEGYVEMIDRLYNYKSQDKIPLAFLASEKAKARNFGVRRGK